MATANCVHPHAQLEHAWAHCEQWHEHHNAHWREHCAVLSTPRTVCRCTCVHTSHLWLKSRPVCHSMSSMHAHLCLVSWVFSPHPSLYFFLQFLFQPFLMSTLVPDEISMEDPLCDSSFGSMVTLDYVNPLTITADHKVLSDNCESRNNHRFAVVVQDLATQWIQAYPCKNKTSQETQRSLQKFLEPERKRKVIYTDNSMEFGKACNDLSWNHCTSTPHRSETNGIAERAVRRAIEGTSAVWFCNQVWMKVGGQILWNVTPICETSQIYCLMGRRPMKDVLGNHFKDRLFHLVHWLSITL